MASTYDTLKASDLPLPRDDVEVLDVLDLPQLYTKPPARALLSALEDLKSAPPSWEGSPRSGTPRSRSGAATPLRRRRKVRNEGVPQYLTKIIASPLAWIEDDEVKETVWETASQRLSERSGRTGMGNMSRIFAIPLSLPEAGEHGPEAPADGEDVVEIALHEPALTADNLGLKTWASSYLLAKRMLILRSSLPPLPPEVSILELGAGTGLVGLSTACILQRKVVLTDLPEIVPNLQRNVDANVALLFQLNGDAEAAVLDWSQPSAFAPPSAGLDQKPAEVGQERACFRLILAADPIYDASHPALLVQAIVHHLSQIKDARVVVEMPIRESYDLERKDFRDRMMAAGLCIVEEGQEVGYDDWGSAQAARDRDDEENEGLVEVTCWWSVWGWR